MVSEYSTRIWTNFCKKYYECENYKSALKGQFKIKLDKIFHSELQEQKLSVVEVKPTCIHAIGAIPGKDRDDPRPITDCSKPYKISINNYMDPEKFSYKTIDNVGKHMFPGCWSSVIDIYHAYRSISVFPMYRQYLGYIHCMDI